MSFRSKFKPILGIALLGFALLILLTGCSGQKTSQDAPSAVQAYLKALADKDENQMINLSCAAWEAQARQEFDSFAAVKLTLQDVSCKQTGQDGAYTLVSCQGSILANYGTEDLKLELADRVFRAVQESGEWRMCGYQ